MEYMNKSKRVLILCSAIFTIVSVTVNFILGVINAVDSTLIQKFLQDFGVYMSIPVYSLPYVIFTFVGGLIGAILLIYAVRKKGKYFRASYSIYIAGFVLVTLCGSYICWLLVFISALIPDVVVMNRPSQVHKEEVVENKQYEEKKEKIETLKKMRDDGLISEEEYKEKLFELL